MNEDAAERSGHDKKNNHPQDLGLKPCSSKPKSQVGYNRPFLEGCILLLRTFQHSESCPDKSV